MKRHWFTYDDGTFYRNCPLIQQEWDEALRRGKFRLVSKLKDEWYETFRRGCQYKDKLGRNEVAIPGRPPSFRVFMPGLVGMVSDAEIDRMDALPNLPGDPKYRWCFAW